MNERSRILRNQFVDAPGSLGQRSRARRWDTVIRTFPGIEDMSVVDFGGTIDYWLRAPIRPRSVHLLNLETPPDEPPPSWLRVDVADACEIPDGMLDESYDLAYSNSVIEHVGGHERRTRFVHNVLAAAPRHWIQTPYRYFPVEPHWVCPMMQYFPLKARARMAMHWPLVHTPHTSMESAIEAQMQVELLDITQMRAYFRASEIVYDRMFGLVKSVIAVQRA